MNLLYAKGTLTDWCENVNDFLYDKCINELSSIFDDSEKYLYGLIGFAIFQFFPYFVQITMLSKIEN
jgi:hypothetical protein